MQNTGKHENRKRLEQNQAEALEAIQAVLNGEALGHQVVRAAVPTSLPRDHFNIQGLTDFIEQLDHKFDQDQNITRYIYTHTDGTQSLVRDARNHQALDPKIESRNPTSIYMQMASSTRAALYMLEANKGSMSPQEYDVVKQRLYVLFNTEIKDINHATNKKSDDIIKRLKDYNALVLSTLKQSPVGKAHGDKLKADLDMTMHVMNVYDKDYHINTIHTFDKKTIIESDVLMLGMTSKQTADLQKIRHNDNPSQLPWYKKLPTYRQGLVRFVSQQVSAYDGKILKKLPTQLRNLMPFGKNMYTKFSYVADNTHKKGFRVVSEAAHTGALYYGVKSQDTQKQVDRMAKQVQTFAPSTKTQINQVSTVSPNNFLNRAEAQVTAQTNRAMHNTKNFATTTPLNLFRKIFGGQDNTGYKVFLSNLADLTTKVLPGSAPVSKYLKTGKGEKAAKEFLVKQFNEAKNDPLKQEVLERLGTAMQARSLLDKRSFFFEKYGNDNLQLGAFFSELNTAVHNDDGAIKRYVAQNHPNDSEVASAYSKIPYDVVNCMSGKDRTGLMMFVATVMGVARFLGKLAGLSREVNDERSLAALSTKLNHAGHTQLIPSKNDVGSHGIMPNSRVAEGISYLASDTLTRETAKSNKLAVTAKLEVNLKKLDQELTPATSSYDKNGNKELERITNQQHEEKQTLVKRDERFSSLNAALSQQKEGLSVSHGQRARQSAAQRER